MAVCERVWGGITINFTVTRVERLAQGAARSVKRTTGQHPGGIVVIPNYMDVYGFHTSSVSGGWFNGSGKLLTLISMILMKMSLKLDVLGRDDPTWFRKLQDLSGIDPNEIPSGWSRSYDSLSWGTGVLGVTQEQIGTPTGMLRTLEFGTNFVREYGGWNSSNEAAHEKTSNPSG